MSSCIEEHNTEPESFNEENLGSSENSPIRGRSRTPKMLNMSSYAKSRASVSSIEYSVSQSTELKSRKSSLLSGEDHLERNDFTIVDMTRMNETILDQSATIKNLEKNNRDLLEERVSCDAREEILQNRIRTLQKEVAAFRAQLKVDSIGAPDSSPNIGQSSAHKRTYVDAFGVSQNQSRRKTRVNNEPSVDDDLGLERIGETPSNSDS